MTTPKCVGRPFRRDCQDCPWSGENPTTATVSDARTGAASCSALPSEQPVHNFGGSSAAMPTMETQGRPRLARQRQSIRGLATGVLGGLVTDAKRTHNTPAGGG